MVPSLALYYVLVGLLLVLTFVLFFFFNDTATTEIYTLSLHDALPIFAVREVAGHPGVQHVEDDVLVRTHRSEEHTSELQSQSNLVCRLLLEKKKSRHARQDVRGLALFRRDRPRPTARSERHVCACRNC